jgi:hypothetical protein
MYGIYGWVIIRDSAYESDDAALSAVVARVRSRVEAYGFTNPGVRLQVLNAEYHLMISGLSNHKNSGTDEVHALLRYVAEVAPASYGIIYVQDDEDPLHDNEFQVWVLARGQLSSKKDPFLSPVVPTIDDPEKQ